MKISIITICYNSASTIRDTFESILMQTYSEIEYVVIDGNSEDGTISLIQEYEAKFNGRMRWISEPDDGIYDAMNKGILLSSGELIGILNSGDIYYDKNVLRDIVFKIKKSSADTLYGDIEFVKSNDINVVLRKWISSPFMQGSFKRGWHPPHPCFFVKKKCYERFGIFDTSFEVSADFELMLRFLEKHKASTIYYNRLMVKMRLGGESTGSIGKIVIGNLGILKAFRKNEIEVSFLYPIYRLAPKLLQFIRK